MVAKRRGSRPGEGPKTLVIVAVTLVLGVGLGALLYRAFHHAPKVATPIVTAPVQQAAKILPPPPTPKPKGPAPGLPAATQFDFYTILPKIHRKSEGIPARRSQHKTFVQPATPRPAARAAPRISPEVVLSASRFILQAASFPDVADANHLRALLALHGLSSYIEKVSISGRGSFYRVRLGPLGQAQLKHERSVLKGMGLNPMVLREAQGN